MPEGLDPIEAGRRLHQHGEEAHRQAEHGDSADAAERHSRIVQVREASLLGLGTVAAARAGSSRGQNRASMPSSQSSGMGPMLAATIGRPAAIASMIASDDDSE